MPIQAAISHYLAAGVYDRHLRQLRRALAAQQGMLVAALQRHFPAGTKWFRPAGGYQLWVELPKGLDALALHVRALEYGISLAPAHVLTAASIPAGNSPQLWPSLKCQD
jgi:DNA-binding transcriptional MocR family regulator